MHITAYAHTNIALIKYWGKLDGVCNLPAVGSLSLTLDNFGTQTTVERIDAAQDQVSIPLADAASHARVIQFLDLVRTLARSSQRCRVVSRNDVPTAAGLASSASAFAALALAATKAFGLELSPAELSRLARIGSGSAARSILGGFAHMPPGSVGDAACYAHSITPAPHLDVALLVIPCAEGPKSLSSREGMRHTQATSPYYPVWVATHSADLTAAIQAVEKGDLIILGERMEHSTLKMHATLLAADPGFCYASSTTLAALQAVKALRAQGHACYFTMDAGPHVKVLCEGAAASSLQQHLFDHMLQAGLPPKGPILRAHPGKAAHLLPKVSA